MEQESVIRCLWCFKDNSLNVRWKSSSAAGGAVYCIRCGHRADVPKDACDCPFCKALQSARRDSKGKA